jgi:hypothetical protein
MKNKEIRAAVAMAIVDFVDQKLPITLSSSFLAISNASLEIHAQVGSSLRPPAYNPSMLDGRRTT